MPDCGLIVFLRFPVKGKIKTRIASSMGDEAALNIYEELTAMTLNVASAAEMAVYLFYEGQVPEEKQNSFHYLLQPEGDLGEKMFNAISYVLQKHNRAIIIGSDCPYLEAADVLMCCNHLDIVDITLGPTEDGRFYMLGCREALPYLFKDMTWSTSSVLEEMIQRILMRDKSFFLLRKLEDIDVEADWLKYKQGNP